MAKWASFPTWLLSSARVARSSPRRAYTSYTTSVSWQTAKSNCEGIGKELASLYTQSDFNDIVNQLSSGDNGWLAANDIDTEGNWYWASSAGRYGSPL